MKHFAKAIELEAKSFVFRQHSLNLQQRSSRQDGLLSAFEKKTLFSRSSMSNSCSSIASFRRLSFLAAHRRIAHSSNSLHSNEPGIGRRIQELMGLHQLQSEHRSIGLHNKYPSVPTVLSLQHEKHSFGAISLQNTLDDSTLLQTQNRKSATTGGRFSSLSYWYSLRFRRSLPSRIWPLNVQQHEYPYFSPAKSETESPRSSISVFSRDSKASSFSSECTDSLSIHSKSVLSWKPDVQREGIHFHSVRSSVSSNPIPYSCYSRLPATSSNSRLRELVFPALTPQLSRESSDISDRIDLSVDYQSERHSISSVTTGTPIFTMPIFEAGNNCSEGDIWTVGKHPTNAILIDLSNIEGGDEVKPMESVLTRGRSKTCGEEDDKTNKINFKPRASIACIT